MPALFARTSENYLKMIQNIKSNALSSTDIDIPVTKGLQVDSNLPQSVSNLQQQADAIRENAEAWANLTQEQKDANDANFDFINASTDVLGIFTMTEESLHKRTQAMNDGKQAAKDLVDETVLHTIEINAEKDALIALTVLLILIMEWLKIV